MTTRLVPLGSTVGDRFEVQRLVGSGGMGHVYRARDRQSGKAVALKVLHDSSEAGVARFQREATLLEGLVHPAIVRYVGSGMVGDDVSSAAPGVADAEAVPFLAMEWIDGCDLASRLAQGPLALGDALALASRLAEGLAEAHRAGVVHRDVKPSNILLENGDPRRPRLADFGIARGGALDARSLTATGATLGTPGFMAPEQIRSERRPTAAADVFALGCVLWTAITGREPFAAATVIATLTRVLFEPIPRLRDAWSEAPLELDGLCSRLLARDPEERPEDGEAALAELRALGSLTLRSSSLAARAAPSALGQGEQRLLSAVLVLTAHASGTETVRADSPEDAAHASLLRPLAGSKSDDTLAATSRSSGGFDVLFELARTFGAELEPVHGAALLVVMRGEGVATDLATRTARCALAFQRELPGAAISVATGRGTSRASGSLGEVSDRAAALLDGANDLGIVIDETTAGLVAERLDVRRAQGKWILAGERVSWLGVRPVLGTVAPCVGRERELDSLLVVADEAMNEPCARACLLVGSAGLGKSRLRTELLRRVEAAGSTFAVWAARGDELSAGAPLGLAGQLVRAAAGLVDGEAPARRQARLAELAGGDVVRAAFLGEMAGTPALHGEVPAIDRARADPVLMSDQLRRVFVDTAEQALAKGPLVLVLEDLHWGDLPSLHLVESALVELSELPLLVVATARPELERAFPGALGRASPYVLRVGPLTPRASTDLARVLLAGAPDDVVARAVEGSAGHPLHIEEIARALRDTPPEGGAGQRFPESVVAMVQARVEALPPAERRILRAASVLGRVFWEGSVASLVGEDAATVVPILARLATREWIEPRPHSRFGGEREHAFRQDAVREAAYAMLTETDRRLGHRLAGTWLAKAGEEPLVLARHHEMGGDPDAARASFALAAEQALDCNDCAAAVDLAEKAASLGAPPESLGALRATQAEACALAGRNAEAVRFGEEALARAPKGSVPWCRAAGAAAQAGGRLGDREAIVRIADGLLGVDGAARTTPSFAAACSPTVVQLLVAGERDHAKRLAEHLGGVPPEGLEPAFLGHLARARGAVLAFTGDLYGSVVRTREAVLEFERAGDPRLGCLLRKTQGWYEGELGALEEAEATLREAVAGAARLRLDAVVAHAKHDLGSPLVRLGKLDEAMALQEEAAKAFEAQGDRRLESGARALLSWIARAKGDAGAAERHGLRATEVAPSDPVRVAALAQLAAARLAAGRTEDALATCKDGLAALERCGVTEEGVPLLRLTLAEALERTGDAPGARDAIGLALSELDDKASRIADPTIRERFLARIEENARTLALAERLGARHP